MKASFIALTVFLVACAASTPPPTRYLLPADVPEGTVRVDPPVRIGISTGSVLPARPRGVGVKPPHLESKPLRTVSVRGGDNIP